MNRYGTGVAADDFSRESRDFFRGKRVLVTGGGGFVGSHAVEQLVALEARPVVPLRGSCPSWLSSLCSVIDVIEDCDLADPVKSLDAARDCAVVLHLAARVGGLSYNLAHPASIFDANMRTALNVARAAVAQRVDRFLLCSSACVYPRHCSIPTPEDEGFRDEPEPTNAGYGWAKRMAEFLVRGCETEFGLPVAIARPYNTYGPRDTFDPERSHVIPALIRKAVEARGKVFEVWGSGRVSRSFLYVDDAARGLIETAARAKNSEPINLGNDEETPIGALAETVADLVGELTGRRPGVRFKDDAPEGQPRRCCDVRRARERIEFTARVPLGEGLRRTIEWYLGQ